MTLPGFDDRLTRELERVARPADPSGVLERVQDRRALRTRSRRTTGAVLAVVVIATTVAGFSVLTELFDGDGRGVVATTPYGSEAAIVTCSDERGGQICRIDGEALARGATDNDFVRLTDLSPGVVASPAVTHDGTTVVFELHDPPGDSREETAELWTMGTDGRGLQRLTTRGSGLTAPSWGPTLLLVAVAGDGVSEDAALAILDPSAGPSPRVATIDLPGLTFPSSPKWSPDGERILFSATAESITDLYTVRIDGSELTNITNSAETEYTPAWSPDGRSIAFWVGSPSGEEIRICPLECSAPRPLSGPDGQPIYGAFPAWSPDGSWIAFQVATGPGTDLHIARIDGSDERVLGEGIGEIAWIPVSTTGTTPTPEPDSSPSAGPGGRDIGLAFRLCHLRPLGGIDFFGDGTNGKAWTGTKVLDDGTCPTAYDDRYGVAVDHTGDGVADSWSGETIDYCGGCEPWKAMDLNGDGRKELIVIVEYFSIMHYGVYTFLDADGRPEIEPFRIGEPGHPEHELDAGKPFTFWVGGDAGLADWFYCETLPEFWLTGIESPIEPPPGAVKTVHRTHVSLMTDGIAHILFADSYTVPAETQLELPYTSPDHSDPDCGIGGVRPG